MIDTHTHLYMTDSFPDGGEAAVVNALNSGVEMMVLPGVDRESVAPLLALHEKFPANTAVALGLHPTEVESDWRRELTEILEPAKDIKIVGIGETGIDLHWTDENLHLQMDAFGEQVQVAIDMGLPQVIHSRDAISQTAEVLRGFSGGLPPMVFHSFTAGRPEAEVLLEAAPEAFFGINGVITYKNAAPLREVVEWLDMHKIVSETDAPFLAPVPHRGKTNESAYIPVIIKAIADVKGIGEDEVKRATVENARLLFPSLP